ncbi:MAG: hypothetical protein ACFFFG_14655 [Candidatus Thorarchaeota archaeon]
MVIIRTLSVIASSNMLISGVGLVFYCARTIQYRDFKRKRQEFGVYLLFYLFAVGANIGNWLILNFIPIWGKNTEIMSILYRITVTLGGISGVILALTLRYDFAPNSYLRRFWQLLMFFGVIVNLLPLLQPLRIQGFSDQLPLFDYSLSAFGMYGMTFFILLVLFWYGIHTSRVYLMRYRSQYAISVFHFLYLIISFGSLLLISFIVSLNLILPMTNQLVALTLTLISTVILVHPTLRWTYLYFYNRRVVEFERNALLDVINHDLTNIAHILNLVCEMREAGSWDDTVMDLLVTQVERMDELIQKARNSVRSGLIEDIQTLVRIMV